MKTGSTEQPTEGYSCSETDYSFCEDSPQAGLRPLSGCGFHPHTPLAPCPLFFRSAAPDSQCRLSLVSLRTTIVVLSLISCQVCARAISHRGPSYEMTKLNYMSPIHHETIRHHDAISKCVTWPPPTRKKLTVHVIGLSWQL